MKLLPAFTLAVAVAAGTGCAVRPAYAPPYRPSPVIYPLGPGDPRQDHRHPKPDTTPQRCWIDRWDYAHCY